MGLAWSKVLSVAAFCAIAVTAFAPSPACADSWLPHEEWSETSSGGEYRFTATPAPHDGHDPIDEDARPTGLLERREGKGEWAEVWRVPLVNDILPTFALVAEDGDYVVTFDNWYSMGRGENVVVIYRFDGSLVRSLRLSDILPETYEVSLSGSVSSTYWLNDAVIRPGGESAELAIYFPGQGWFSKEDEPVRLILNLADGSLTVADRSRWETALAASRAIALEGLRRTLKYEGLRRVPLTAPETCSEGLWDFYFSEVFDRLAPVGSDYQYVPSTILLPLGGAGARRRFVNFVSFAADRRSKDNQRAVAAPCAQEELLRATRAIAKRADETGDAAPFKALTLNISASKALFLEIEALLNSTGARLVWLDPDFPLPQRADRIPDNDDEVAQWKVLEAELADQVEKDRAAGYVFKGNTD